MVNIESYKVFLGIYLICIEMWIFVVERMEKYQKRDEHFMSITIQLYYGRAEIKLLLSMYHSHITIMLRCVFLVANSSRTSLDTIEMK